MPVDVLDPKNWSLKTLHHIQFDEEGKYFCDEHKECTHVRAIFCQACLQKQSNTAVLSNVDLYAEREELRHDKKILSAEVSRLYQFLDELAVTLSEVYNVPDTWNTYTGRLKTIHKPKEKIDGKTEGG